MKIKRKEVFVFGLFLFFAGLLTSIYYNIPVEKRVETTSPVANSPDGYNVTGFFNSDEKLIVQLPTSFRSSYIPIPFNVTIFCPPDDSKVIFKVEFLGDVTQGIIEYNYTVLKNDGGLEVEEGILGGVTKQTGNYTAQLSEEARYLYGDPPKTLALYKVIENKIFEYPYRNLLPVGIALACIGGIFIFWAIKIRRTIAGTKHRKIVHDAGKNSMLKKLNCTHILLSFLLIPLIIQVAQSAGQVTVIFLFKDPSTIPHCQRCPSCCVELYDDFSTKNYTMNVIQSNYTGQVVFQWVEYDSYDGQNYRNNYSIIRYNSLIVMDEKGNYTTITGIFNETYIKEVIDAYLAEETPKTPQPPHLAVILGMAFSLGLLETISPCLIALLSFALSYTVGEGTRFMDAFLKVITFGVGFVLSSIFVLAGLSVGLIIISSSFYEVHNILMLIICVLAIFFGINLLGIRLFKHLRVNIETKPLIQKLTKKYAFTYTGLALLGLLFYFLDPCLAPAFAGIMSTLAPNMLLEYLPLILFVFCLGVFIPFIGIGLLAGSISKLVRIAYRYRTKIRVLSGLILILYATYLIVDYFIIPLIGLV